MARGLVLLGMLLLLPGSAWTLEWGNVEPGVTTQSEVRSRYGAPTKETSAKVEGYDTVQWIYDEPQAPDGMYRMTIDFGLLTPAGYRPSTVRLLKLEPKPGIFTRNTIVDGWGVPDSVGAQEGVSTAFYREGLFVVLDKEGNSAVTMIFSPPQPEEGTKGATPSPPPPLQKK
ncbi:MAG TPA: hypothetical protein VEL75_00940 [Candidatus Methylomirabilis sp.]|nr:hypothetical protein [Candidatus Methylomirabilis sp.]